MIVTGSELLGLSQISGGGPLPGIPVDGSGVEAATAALASLTTKGVVDQAGKLTDFGVLPTMAVQHYREARKHVVFNELRASVNRDGALTVLQPAEGGWSLTRMAAVALMVVLLEAYPFLRGGGPDAEPGPWEVLNAGDWAAGRASGSLLVTALMSPGRSPQVVALDERAGMGFEYDVSRGRARVTPLWRLRHKVADMVGCQGSIEKKIGGLVHG